MLPRKHWQRCRTDCRLYLKLQKKEKMILVDFSQVAIAGCYAFQSDFKKGRDTQKMRDIIRHSFLTSILGIKKNHAKKYGEIVFACDGSRSWRKDTFKHYKANRAKGREDSDLDWSAIFDHINNLQEEMIKFFQWRVIKINGAEGDDIIGVLTKYVTDTRVKLDGLFEAVEPVLIVSSDKDFFQLHTIPTVVQYSPIQKKMVGDSSPDFLIEKIIRGDAGDGICNIKSSADSFVTGTRQNAISKKFVSETIDSKLANLSNAERARFDQNQLLIDFNYIPHDIQEKIIHEFNSQDKSNWSLTNTFDFLISVRAKQLLDRIQEFGK
jgi:hypothetical protein